MNKETTNLLNFYDNRIKELENKNKEKQDKLDKIEEYMTKGLGGFDGDNLIWSKQHVLQIIKGEDK